MPRDRYPARPRAGRAAQPLGIGAVGVMQPDRGLHLVAGIRRVVVEPHLDPVVLSRLQRDQLPSGRSAQRDPHSLTPSNRDSTKETYAPTRSVPSTSIAPWN